jgi:hypothetical protein
MPKRGGIKMNNLKNVGIVAVLACMLLSLCACGGETAVETKPAVTEAPVVVATEAPAQETEAALPEGMVKYTVTVVDEAGTPVVGAMVQLCKDSCVPAVTDASGVATFTLPEDDYKASMLAMPAGYAYAGEADTFYFEGAFELTITLKTAE